MFVFEAMPAWSTNRLSRLLKGSKRYMTDSSLVAAALRLDEETVLRDGDLLGRLIDTFVVSQLRAEVETSGQRARLYHLREKDGRHEIDVIAEVSGGDVIALNDPVCKMTARRDGPGEPLCTKRAVTGGRDRPPGGC
jgi:predicted AAA+ superfamily ATPase